MDTWKARSGPRLVRVGGAPGADQFDARLAPGTLRQQLSHPHGALGVLGPSARGHSTQAGPLHGVFGVRAATGKHWHSEPPGHVESIPALR